MLNLVASSILYPEIIIRSSVSIASNLITSVQYLSSITKNDIEIQNLLDIVEDIVIIKTFIEEKKNNSNNNYESKTVDMCIDNLNQTLYQLEANINSITEKIQTHKDKWFNKFRAYDISAEKNHIPILIKQMRHKFELLIKVSSNLK
jgi:hypothetical protein